MNKKKIHTRNNDIPLNPCEIHYNIHTRENTNTKVFPRIFLFIYVRIAITVYMTIRRYITLRYITSRNILYSIIAWKKYAFVAKNIYYLIVTSDIIAQLTTADFSIFHLYYTWFIYTVYIIGKTLSMLQE